MNLIDIGIRVVATFWYPSDFNIREIRPDIRGHALLGAGPSHLERFSKFGRWSNYSTRLETVGFGEEENEPD